MLVVKEKELFTLELKIKKVLNQRLCARAIFN